MGFVELEIGLHRREAGNYTVELRFSSPDSDADAWVTAGRLPVVKFDSELLHQQSLDAHAYGRLLTESLFGNGQVRAAYAGARASADGSKARLRVRLLVGPSAPELHGLCWEALQDPENGSPLFTGERTLLSRYLSSTDWRPVRRRPKARLRALIVIANPTDVNCYQPGGRPLAALDVATELARAREGLAGIPCIELASGGSATIDGLVRHLRGGDDIDILYLVCHGAMVEGDAWLWLENEAGKARRLAGSELIQRIRELRQPPVLVVLASCQSAGGGAEAHTSDAGAFAALGPGLAEAGVPAVLAMQGNVTIATMAKFMPVFFRELQHDGQIDRAVAAARGTVRERADWHVPVLFMRLKGGCLWYSPGFDEAPKLERWPALLANIRSKRCTPIVGPGLTDRLLGSRREIAQRWADTFGFPMAPHNREDLPQVAQFLAVNQQPSFPHTELISYLHRDLLERYSDELPVELRSADHFDIDHLDQLVSILGVRQRKLNPAEPFQVLAGLPLPIYVTAAPNDLLTDALREAGKQPRVDFCRWKEELMDFPGAYKDDPNFRPDERQPLVYHVFGRLQYSESLVITEDDFFDFLIGMKKNQELTPSVVRRALADSGLLFLGFQLDEWNFRIMFRAIMDQEGGKRRTRYAHVAAQIDPEEGRILEPQRARKYLENYFNQSAISIYWGGPDDFARDLLERWQDRSA